MMLIPCPHCGLRDESEFRYAGEAQITRPGPRAADAAWTAYFYARINAKGPVEERWFHAHGCRQWFIAVRDTATHRWLPAQSREIADEESQ